MRRAGSFSKEKLSTSKPKITLNRRVFYVLISSLIVLIVLVPILVYWGDQTLETHSRWNNETNYAQLIRQHLDSAANLINGTSLPWNNESESFAQTELTSATTSLYFLGYLDWSHVNQLSIIADKVYTVSAAFYLITYSHRVSISTHLHSLANKIIYAYFLNDTSSANGVGPPFWYSGPGLPNERDLQDAVSIAGNLTG